MYLQITTRCNMSCQHCCYGCTANGKDISLENAYKAIALAAEHGEMIMLGGGEPTLHKHFELILLRSLMFDMKPAIVTNGSIKERALLIAKLTRADVICGELSSDKFHDPIDVEVFDAFDNINAIRDITLDNTIEPTVLGGREINRRGLTRAPKELFPNSFTETCLCDDTFVRPNGKIYQCGCKTSPCIGDVNTDYHTVWQGVCYRDDDYKEALETSKKQVA
jgi:sulfatase maturation enzyme AslB (radical SAM superfamily)